MIASLRRLAPNTIAGQITGLVIVAVVLGVGLASAVLFNLYYQGQAGPNTEILAAIRAARIAAIVHEAQAAPSRAELQRALGQIHSNSVEVTPVPSAGLRPAIGESPRAVAAIEATLRDNWGLAPLARGDAIFIKLNDETALRFDISPHGGLHNLLLVQTICALAIITFIILFLSIYAVRWVTSPLSEIAAAARSFGGAGEEDALLGVDGPLEIAQAAMALNEMRKRVRSLVNGRTQMLIAISHDLRTPLTRLRLRVERLKDPSTRAPMLEDIGIINAMLGETLAYVREGNQHELAAPADLPSLLQTICAQFSDMGHDVAYIGPDRHAFSCRAQALGRAVTNLVENATKHGAAIEVALRVINDSAVEIVVSDDGPGIPAGLMERIFEPFFKADSARPLNGGAGFGLGLSIARDIIERHGGAIYAANREPRGLAVRLVARALPVAAPWEIARIDSRELRDFV